MESLDLALASDLVWVEVDSLETVKLALETDLTTYDACYLALSRNLGAELVTFDQKLASAANNQSA